MNLKHLSPYRQADRHVRLGRSAATPIDYHHGLAAGDLDRIERARAEGRSRFAALVITFSIHILILAALAWIILDRFDPEVQELEITPAAEGEKTSKIVPKIFAHSLLRRPSSIDGGAFDMISASVPSPVSVVSITNFAESFGSGLGNDFGDGIDGFAPGGAGPFGLDPRLKGRCNQADRAKRLRENGGTPALDRRVILALEWLMKRQNIDGSWGQAYPVAMTGFAILAFSGHCETVDSPRYGATLVKAINYLVGESRDTNGLMASKPGAHTSYEHGIATYALAEAYSLNKNARAKFDRISPVLRNAVPIIIEGQTKSGGWLYSYGQSGAGDLSISGWNIQALKAAQLSGIKFAGMDRTMKNALAYLEVAAAADGLYKYRIRDGQGGRLSLTGVGVLCGRMLGQVMADEDKSLDAILAYRPKQFRSADLYALYYHSQACFQKGGDTWTEYNRTQQKLVIDSQEKDGSWPVAAGHIGAARADAKIYHSCLCALMLEIYYRYLPATDTRK